MNDLEEVLISDLYQKEYNFDQDTENFDQTIKNIINGNECALDNYIANVQKDKYNKDTLSMLKKLHDELSLSQNS